MVMCPREYKDELSRNLMLVYTGASREAGSILQEQKANTKQPDKRQILTQMRDLAIEMKHCLMNKSSLDTFGKLLHQGWMLKRRLAGSISNPQIDEYYDRALSAGALGGKLLGAGGGGFLLLCCPLEKQGKVQEALSSLVPMKFSFENEGSKIIYVI